MILNSQPKQFRLLDDGQILWQKDATNPMPGVAVARIKKGEAILQPAIDLIESETIAGEDSAALVPFITAWLHQHIGTVLEKLVGLAAPVVPALPVNPESGETPASEAVPEQAKEPAADPVGEISRKLHDALGILPRQSLESLIAALDPDRRKALRQRHVRLGPILVFVPELSKPAAVRLRALLWRLWNDRALPAPVPKDGVVSMLVDEAGIDADYQRAIGYPVYGGRAIRVDMLDRLICGIYDAAKDGSFKATHTMAEWLGASIPDLYKVLEAMGHRKTFDPAEQKQPDPAANAVPADGAPDATAARPEGEKQDAEKTAAPVETPAEAKTENAVPKTSSAAPPDMPAASEASAPEASASEAATAPKPVVKPDLATFRLKRGKANDGERPRGSRPPRARVAPQPKVPPPFEKLTEDEMAAIRERNKAREEARLQREQRDKPSDRPARDRNSRDKNPRSGGFRDKGPREEKTVFAMEAKPEKSGESPFAMLGQLKVAKKD